MSPNSFSKHRVGLVSALGALCLVMVTWACGKGGECPAEFVKCGSDGTLHCYFAPPGVMELPAACCAPAVQTDAGDADAGETGVPTEQGAGGADAGDADAGADECGAPDGGTLDGGTNPKTDAGADADGGESVDGGALRVIIKCGVNICQPFVPDAGLPDAGPGGFQGSGEL